MLKKLVLVLLVMLISVSTLNCIYASEVQTDSSSFYEEKGQIIFDSVKLTNKNGRIEIQKSTNMEQSQKLAQKLDDPDIQNILSKYMGEGKTPVAIGWTKVYLKDSKDPNNKTGVVPMTIEDVERLSSNIASPNDASGTPTVKGNFTLYTLVGYDNYDPAALFAESIGKWNGGQYGSNGPANDNDDFMTITWPNGYVLTSSAVFGDCSEPYKKDEAYSSVVWGFGEESGEVILASNGRNDNSSGTRKWVSKYVHTWAETVPSFNISLTDVGITLTNSSASWQIASSLIY
ncbi:hypothetical protein V6B95_00225 [Thermoanaerobacterium saccharolyticum]|uniref:Uncharacterized protein n=1 Tax=Thermoanaerobacterium thermosaccharolyticum M0795 TaxID=698948 RepID=L0II43_THETR|nr:hypothetical protein [Thermoanaerobacterium thermosaccharolyticum]AGB19190.1 hypothetical protein Thethe_01553 [Thermoanaerobacterium thermosaccharolyticum M0795]